MQQFFANADSMIIGVLGAIFLFGFAVFVHELGHFLAAKACGVAVKAFAIGFGPRVIAFHYGGTEYSLRWIPLGGFVALKGMLEEEGLHLPDAESGAQKTGADAKPVETGEPAPPATETIPPAPAAPPPPKKASITEDLDALRNKPALARIAVFGAGVTMNFLTAILFCGLLLWYGLPKYTDVPNILEDVPQKSEWHKAGWRSGDRILALLPDSHFPTASTATLSTNAPTTASIPAVHPPHALQAIHTAETPSTSATSATAETSGTIKTWTGVMMALNTQLDLALAANKGQKLPTSLTLQAVVERTSGTTQTLLLPLPITLIALEGGVFNPPYPPVIGIIQPASPAHRARLVKENYQPGEKIRPFPTFDEMPPCPLESDDRVLEVENTPIASWNQMARIIRASKNSAVLLTVERGPEKKKLRIMAVLESNPQDPNLKQLAVMMGRERASGRDNLPFLQAAAQAPGQAWFIATTIVNETAKLFARGSSVEIKRNLGGPAVIGIMAYKTAQRGLSEYLHLFAVISLILGIMNLLPIPVLDGGYITIALIEAIIRRPIPQRILVPLLTVFMALFLMLFAFIFFNDFMNWVVKS